jgi:hypothetical protein
MAALDFFKMPYHEEKCLFSDNLPGSSPAHLPELAAHDGGSDTAI